MFVSFQLVTLQLSVLGRAIKYVDLQHEPHRVEVLLGLKTAALPRNEASNASKRYAQEAPHRPLHVMAVGF